MIFMHTWQKILSGKKTQTRRLIKGVNLVVDIHGNPNATDSPFYDKASSSEIECVLTEKGWLRYHVNHTYAVQTGRSKGAVGRIRILSIRRQDVRDISPDDIRAEGFSTSYDFLWVWCQLHDKPALKLLMNTEQVPELPYHIPLWMADRPAHLYDAWALKFELVKGGVE